MNFVNNWSRAVTLASGATALALDLPDGNYRLSITDNLSAPTRWEILNASIISGSASLTRAQEGTTDQEWPAGSIVYCTLTAGLLAQLLAQLADLQARVTAIEAGGATANGLTDEAGNYLVDDQGNYLTGV